MEREQEIAKGFHQLLYEGLLRELAERGILTEEDWEKFQAESQTEEVFDQSEAEQ